MPVIRFKLRAGMGGDTQSYQEQKKPGGRLLGTHPSFQRDVINPSSVCSDGSTSRGLLGGRLDGYGCTHDDNNHPDEYTRTEVSA